MTAGFFRLIHRRERCSGGIQRVPGDGGIRHDEEPDRESAGHLLPLPVDLHVHVHRGGRDGSRSPRRRRSCRCPRGNRRPPGRRRSPASTGSSSSGTSWTGSTRRSNGRARRAPSCSPHGAGRRGQRYFFRRNRSVFTETTRSRKRTPSRWSISCWIATASNPIDSMILRSPSRPRASTSTHWARWTLAV